MFGPCGGRSYQKCWTTFNNKLIGVGVMKGCNSHLEPSNGSFGIYRSYLDILGDSRK